MQFRIADTFTDSLARLTNDEQKAVKTTAFDLQMNPAHPSLQFHKLDRAKDPRFWSVRVSQDIRLIIHRSDASLLLCYVDHHDEAYRWAERRKLETHPKTGAAQFVEIRERVEEIPVYVHVAQPAPEKPALFAHYTHEALLAFGVPEEWVEDVRSATEATILELSDHLPAEAAEALLEIATGGSPRPVAEASPEVAPFEHPDAQRRFRVVANVEELERALEFPWDKWTLFLHPSQRDLVERDFSGPARVSGTAGTGKTIVALHRAVHLARQHPEARVLLTTFSDTLANALRGKLRRLIHNEPRLGERLEVHAIDAIGRRLNDLHFGAMEVASRDKVRSVIRETAAAIDGHSFSLTFLYNEWENVVDAWRLETWEAYRDVRRLGRKTRLPESQRLVLWSLFDRVRLTLEREGLMTYAQMYTLLADRYTAEPNPPFECIVVDEAQDVSVAQLRFLAAMAGGRPNALFFAGDLGQRIFQQPFSWASLGVEVRGRSRTLRINYRTSHQIRRQADLLLSPEITDVDGNTESRRGAISVFNGPPPVVEMLDSPEAEIEGVSQWLAEREDEGVAPHEIGVVVRSEREIARATAAVEAAGMPYRVLDDTVETTTGFVSISTMHRAKGLEFRAVVVMACDDDVIPSQERIETVSDQADLEEVYHTERHLLYVACTRARDQLLVTSGGPASEFLEDMRG
ncbi:MAG: 3'-5' exonuclease [Rhodothermales bacterium]